MKKSICFFLLLVVLFSVSGQETVSEMIKSDLFQNADKISEASQSLTEVQKLMLYQDCKKDGWGGFAGNLLLGAGIGSFFQGDNSAGWETLIFTIVGLGAVLLSPKISNDNVRLGTLTAGYTVLVGVRVGSLIAPFSYANSYNKKLKEVLHYSVP